jgi:hypothetical protein
VALVRGLFIPFYGFGLVFSYAFAYIIRFGEVYLGFDETLVRGLFKPFYGFGLIRNSKLNFRRKPTVQAIFRL